MHRLGPCSFIPEVSHAIIIKHRNRSLCDTGSVRKSRKINGFTTTFRLHNGYNPSIEFIIIGQSRHEKDLVLCLMRILARCVEVLRQFDFPLKGRSELFEPRRFILIKIRTVSIPLLPTGMRNWNFSILRKELCTESFPEPLMK